MSRSQETSGVGGWRRAALLAALVQIGAAPALAAPEIQNARVEPTPFSPDGLPPADRDTTFVYYTVTGAADSVLVRVQGDGIQPFRLSLHAPAEARSYVDAWDGRDGEGDLVPDGDYNARIFLYERGFVLDAVDQGISVDTAAPDLSLVPPFPESPISPDEDGVHDALLIGVDVELAGPRDATSGELRDRAGQLIAPLRLPDGEPVFLGAGHDTLLWAGEVAEPPLTEGLFFWTIRTADPAENRDELTGAVSVDLLPPSLALEDSLPAPLRFSNPDTSLTFSGTATDTISGVTDLEFSPDDGVTWIDIYDGSEETVPWTRVHAFDPYRGEGSYTYLVRSTDGQAHTNERGGEPPPVEIRVVYDATPPAHDSTYAFRPELADGDTVVIRTTWSEDSLSLEADFGGLDPTFVAGSEEVETLGGGEYELRYALPGDSGIELAELVPIPITARDGANPAVTAPSPVRVTLDNLAPVVGSYDLLSGEVHGNGDSVIVVANSDGSG
ncbi:MAG: hypothetical protein QF860_03280, partial [Planctomycetota bacterium]|nr:hypothetical protein [Planctomycetota bacterium]